MVQQCSSCGADLIDQSPQCESCGAIQETFVYRSRVAASALAFFAGIFGAHRFFLGQWWGVFYILFCWTYIPWIVALIEGIVFLSTSQKRWNDKYNKGVFAGSEKGTVVIVLACVMPVIFTLGILAAVAIPAYHDYGKRAQISKAHGIAETAIDAVEDYFEANHQWPRSVRELNIVEFIDYDYVSSIVTDRGTVYVHIPEQLHVSGSIIYVPTVSDSGVSWSCKESTIEPRLLPPQCR